MNRDGPIIVAPGIRLFDDQIELSFIRASGPGGQNVNKVSTAVQLRFNVAAAGLPPQVQLRLEKLAGQRLTQDGCIILTAQSHRSQERNREDAIARLVALIRKAAVQPKARRATRPTLGSKRRRVESKQKRGSVKSLRGKPTSD